MLDCAVLVIIRPPDQVPPPSPCTVLSSTFQGSLRCRFVPSAPTSDSTATPWPPLRAAFLRTRSIPPMSVPPFSTRAASAQPLLSPPGPPPYLLGILQPPTRRCCRPSSSSPASFADRPRPPSCTIPARPAACVASKAVVSAAAGLLIHGSARIGRAMASRDVAQRRRGGVTQLPAAGEREGGGAFADGGGGYQRLRGEEEVDAGRAAGQGHAVGGDGGWPSWGMPPQLGVG